MRLNPRLVGAAVLLLALVGASVALASSWRDASGGEGGAYAVLIEGPEGALFDGIVRVEEATALTLLEAAAAQAGLALEKEEYSGMGTYVRAIGPHRAGGASGWIYEVQREGAWVAGDRSAEFFALREGEALRWRWTEGGGA